MAQQPSQQQFGMQSSQSASGLQHSSMSSNPPQALGNVAGGSSSNLSASTESANKEKLEQLVLDLVSTEKREKALLELSKARETYKDLAPVLWYSFGTIAALLQEIVSIYPLLSPPSLTIALSNRVCNSLALLQCVATHPDTRQLFLNAQIPLFLYPFLNTVSEAQQFEFLRLTSLGVIGALVKEDDAFVISFLLQTEIIPLCLRIMEIGCELSKTVATFIIQKILLDEQGLNYICATAERFFAVSTVLTSMVEALKGAQSARLLKHIVRCYLRLCDNPRAQEALKKSLPESLKDPNFFACLKDDATTLTWRTRLLKLVNGQASAQSNLSSASIMQSMIASSNQFTRNAAGRPMSQPVNISHSNYPTIPRNKMQ